MLRVFLSHTLSRLVTSVVARRRFAHSVAVSLIALTLGSQPATASSEDICPPSPLFMAPIGRQVDLIELQSDQASSRAFKQFSFDGNVQLLYRSQLIQADKVEYDQESAIAIASGAIRYQLDNLFLSGTRAQFELATKRGQVTGASYFYRDQHVTGFAEQIEFDQQHAKLREASFSTCIETPRVWELRAADLNLDISGNEGSAHDVSLRLYDVPVAYLPYISFPLGKRKSGLLTPRFGNKSATGVEASIPYYWNIAPNYDATIAPQVMSKRGLLVQNEFRYLSSTDRGEIHVDFIPHDIVRKKSRGAFALSHRGALSDQLTFYADLNRVTDYDYLREFGGSLETLSTHYVPSEVAMAWYDNDWRATLRAQDFQLISYDYSAAYRRLPQINFYYLNPRYPLRWGTNAEFAYFDRAYGTVGNRFWVEPFVAAPIEFAAMSINPEIRWRQIEYVVAPQRGGEFSRQSFGNYTWDVSGKMFFERDGENTLQQLTPIVGHHYTPIADQSQLPVFDTSAVDFRISQLLNSQRYDGGDRIGDAHFVSAGASWSMLHARSMRRLGNFTLINAYYFADQQLQLGGESNAKKRDIVSAGQFDAYISEKISFNGRMLYDWRKHLAEKGIMQFHFNADENGFNLSYRFRQPEIEQVSVAGYFDLRNRWRLNARASYSVIEQRVQETAIGTEYNSCCFSLRLIAQYYADPVSGEGNTAFGAQIELRGLASFGESSAAEFSQEFVTRRYRYDVF